MKLTMKGDYGLRAMLDMAAYYGQGPIESSDIATRQHIPEQYLDQILMVLRKEGLVKSVRGPKGGHMLAKSPSQITMAQVMQALEGCSAYGMPTKSRLLQVIPWVCIAGSLAKD